MSSDLERMRAFVAAVLSGGAAAPDPPLELIQRAHLGPIAYRMGVTALRHEYAASMIVAERRRHLLAEVVGALHAAGVRSAPIKGIGFIGTIYPDAAERPMNDIDLLVPAALMHVALRTMTSLGFERVGYSRKLSGYYHALAFSREGLMVELHRHIVQHGRTSLRMADVWRRATPATAAGGAERLEPVDELLICMLHIARHELAVPAINFVDVSRLWRRLDAVQRATLAERAEAYRVARAISAVRSMTDLLAAGRHGRPEVGLASRVLPTTDDVLLGKRPRRARQLGQKLVLVQGPRELVGLTIAWAAAIASGARRTE